MTFKCPYCQCELETDLKQGEFADCPNCGQTIEVPERPSLQNAVRLAKASAAPRHSVPKVDVQIPWVGAIVVLLLVLPIGLPAVIFAALASGANASGDSLRASSHAKVCRILTTIGEVLILVWLLFGIVVGACRF